METEPTGVVFPETNGRRSTTALGRAVVADALADVDPVGARAAEGETNWRTGYVDHFRRLVEAGLVSRDAWLTIAARGLDALHRRMRVRFPDGTEGSLDDWEAGEGDVPLDTAVVRGEAERERELSVPYRGERLQGHALSRQLDEWVARGVVEPSCAEAVRTVAANPEWLALAGRRVAVLGAGAEMGPLQALLRWGAEVVAVDLPRPPLWARIMEVAGRSSGTLLVPVRGDREDREGRGALGQRAGADLLHDLPAVARWLRDVEGRLVLGNYVYADGATNVRVAMAVDLLTRRLMAAREELALAFLATPTDVFAVPADAVAQAHGAYEERSSAARLAGRPLRWVSGGRLLQRNYVPGADPAVNDSLVPQQGPNYALAKRLQRWRATMARAAGTTVSLHVAPPTRTSSVVRNRALAAAYAGAPRFGVEVFEPGTSNTLMAALLVHDLSASGAPAGQPPSERPWEDEAHAAAHGGLWRCPYNPRSVLGLAAVLGVGAARA